MAANRNIPWRGAQESRRVGERRPHHNSMHLNLLDDLLLSVIKEPIVDPLPDELQGRLRTKGVLGWHVEVIHKGQQLLPSNWNIDT